MNELTQQIRDLNGPQVSEAVKNLRIALQFHWQHEVNDEEVREALQASPVGGDAETLRHHIVGGEKDVAEMERWGKSLLLYAVADPELRPFVGEAVEDARQSSVKDFGLSSLLVIGAVLVLLKWRPKKFEHGTKGTKIEWEDNDVAAVETLAKLTTGDPG
ncbi:MAG: hypothetical protein ABW250_22060 [Pyrinomonadaceae bacterium]